MDEVIGVVEDLVPVLHEVHAVAMAVAAAVSEITQAAKPPLHDFAPVIRRSFSRVLRVLLEDSDLVAWDVADVDDMLLRVLGDARGRLKEVPMLFLRGRLSREEQNPASDEHPERQCLSIYGPLHGMLPPVNGAGSRKASGVHRPSCYP